LFLETKDILTSGFTDIYIITKIQSVNAYWITCKIYALGSAFGFGIKFFQQGQKQKDQEKQTSLICCCNLAQWAGLELGGSNFCLSANTTSRVA
jgi:hypothetical protein